MLRLEIARTHFASSSPVFLRLMPKAVYSGKREISFAAALPKEVAVAFELRGREGLRGRELVGGLAQIHRALLIPQTDRRTE